MPKAWVKPLRLRRTSRSLAPASRAASCEFDKKPPWVAMHTFARSDSVPEVEKSANGSFGSRSTGCGDAPANVARSSAKRGAGDDDGLQVREVAQEREHPLCGLGVADDRLGLGVPEIRAQLRLAVGDVLREADRSNLRDGQVR